MNADNAAARQELGECIADLTRSPKTAAEQAWYDACVENARRTAKNKKIINHQYTCFCGKEFTELRRTPERATTNIPQFRKFDWYKVWHYFYCYLHEVWYQGPGTSEIEYGTKDTAGTYTTKSGTTDNTTGSTLQKSGSAETTGIP